VPEAIVQLVHPLLLHNFATPWQVCGSEDTGHDA
jgi:hypothetical protein